MTEKIQPVTTMTNAQALGHSDSASRYWDETSPDIRSDFASLDFQLLYGWSRDELVEAYVHYYVGTWNAMISMDREAESIGVSPIHGRWRDLPVLEFKECLKEVTS